MRRIFNVPLVLFIISFVHGMANRAHAEPGIRPGAGVDVVLIFPMITVQLALDHANKGYEFNLEGAILPAGEPVGAFGLGGWMRSSANPTHTVLGGGVGLIVADRVWFAPYVGIGRHIQWGQHGEFILELKVPFIFGDKGDLEDIPLTVPVFTLGYRW